MASYFFDNCIPWQVATALTLVEVQACHLKDIRELGTDATDRQIAEWCQQNRAVWVTADLSASKRRSVQEIPLLARINIAFFRPPFRSGWTRRQFVQQVLRRVDAMEKLYDAEYPVWYRFSARGAPKPVAIPRL
jgi:hypothetical protein